jgi:hypothetical protein
MNVLPVDMSNSLVHVPVRAHTILVNGIPVQSVATFDYSANDIEIADVYKYAAAVGGLDPYLIDVNDITKDKRRIDQAYTERAKDMKVHPIMHSNKYGVNLYPLYKA